MISQMKTSYQTEFPDFGDLPPLVAARLSAGHLVDLSWSQDICPSFCTPHSDQVMNGEINNVPVLWVDYADPAQREFGAGMQRFGVALNGMSTSFDSEAEALEEFDRLNVTREGSR